MMTKRFRIFTALTASALTLGGMGALGAACGGGGNGEVGGPVEGSADTHCIAPDGGLITQPTSQAACDIGPPDAGVGAPDADLTPDYGATMYGSAGNDDDCKYHVEWTSTPIEENEDVFFTVVATVINDATMPVTGANILAEVFLNDTHPAPPTNQSATETPPGTYKVGPIQFDAPGIWTVRFHLFENCIDYEDDSPHGHAAFFVDVP